MVTSRIWFTAAQKAELWERWKNGQSDAAISRALERKNKTGVERIVVLHGGIAPAPALDFSLCHRMIGRPADMRHVLFVEPCRQLRRDVARAVVG